VGAHEEAEYAVSGSLTRDGAIISLNWWRRRKSSMRQPTLKMEEAMGSKCARFDGGIPLLSFVLILNLTLGFLARLRRRNAGRELLVFGGHCHWLPCAKAAIVNARWRWSFWRRASNRKVKR